MNKMLFTHDGKIYRLRFSYPQKVRVNGTTLSQPTTNPGKLTHAIVEMKDGLGWMVSKVAHAQKCDEDSFVKETGRKVALEKVLSSYSRDFRIKAWEAYYGRLTAND